MTSRTVPASTAMFIIKGDVPSSPLLPSQEQIAEFVEPHLTSHPAWEPATQAVPQGPDWKVIEDSFDTGGTLGEAGFEMELVPAANVPKAMSDAWGGAVSAFVSKGQFIRQNIADIQHHLSVTTSSLELVESLRPHVAEGVWGRLRDLLDWENPDSPNYEPDQEPINLEALKKFAKFIVETPGIPDPGIGVGSGGSITASWRLEPFGLLSVTFSSKPMIRFGATSSVKNPLTDEMIPSEEQWRFSGTFPNNSVLKRMLLPPITLSWNG